MDLVLILEKSQPYRVHRRITPTLVEEPPSAVKVLEIFLVWFASPEAQVTNLEVGPEMARRVAIGLDVVVPANRVVLQPFYGTIRMNVLWMICDKLLRRWPKSRNTLRAVVKVHGEAIGLVVILHVAEDIIVDIAEEVYIWLHAPIVLHVQ